MCVCVRKWSSKLLKTRRKRLCKGEKVLIIPIEKEGNGEHVREYEKVKLQNS